MHPDTSLPVSMADTISKQVQEQLGGYYKRRDTICGELDFINREINRLEAANTAMNPPIPASANAGNALAAKMLY